MESATKVNQPIMRLCFHTLWKEIENESLINPWAIRRWWSLDLFGNGNDNLMLLLISRDGVALVLDDGAELLGPTAAHRKLTGIVRVELQCYFAILLQQSVVFLRHC